MSGSDALHIAFEGDWEVAGVAALKAIALVLTAVVLFRVTVRRTLAEQAPFDIAVVIAVGAVIGRTATASDTPYLTGAMVLVGIFFIHSVITRLRFLPGVEKVVDPPGRVLVRDGVVDSRMVRRCGLTANDFAGVLREQGVLDVADVEIAIFEGKGSVTVQKRS